MLFYFIFLFLLFFKDFVFLFERQIEQETEELAKEME